MMLYRYLKTHAYETLRDRRFMISPPGKFNDLLDCTAKIKGEPSAEVLQKRYGAEGGFIANAFRAGYSPEAILSALNSGRLKDIDPKDYARVAQKVVNNGELAKNNLRILCLADSDGYPKTDLRMWRRYASFGGVRIGLNFGYDPMRDQFAFLPVQYKDEQAIFDLSEDDCQGKALDIKSMVTTKLMQWAPEREHRLITRPEYCKHIGELDFLSFNSEIVQRVDIGFKMRHCESKGLVKMIRGKYPNVKIYRMFFDRMSQKIVYEPLAK